jgi:hypothetical protein
MSEQLPGWLTDLADQRLALIEEAAIPATFPVVVTPLREPPETATAREREQWERSCDCCGKWCPYPREDFYTGSIQRNTKAGVLVLIPFGVCKEHKFDG